MNTQIQNMLQERRLPTAAYPLKGLLHFLHHPKRHAGPILLSILKVMVTSSVVVYPLMKFGYTPQRKLIAQLYKPGSVMVGITSSILALLETSAVTIQLATHFLGNIRNRLFDSVLKERHSLPSDKDVSAVASKVGGPAIQPLQKHAFLSPANIMILSAQIDDSWSIVLLRPAVFVMTLPLNIVPVVGPLCFISIQALFRGGMAHRRYFQLYQWTEAQRQRRIEGYFWQYQRFGMVATALEMIPFIGYLFMYTNQLGAALWAMDLHDCEMLEPASDSSTALEA